MDPMEYLLLSLGLGFRADIQPGLNIFVSAFQHLPPSYWKYTYIQSVPKKGDPSNPSNYHPSLSKAFETILNRKVFQHLSTSYLLSDHQYGFSKGCPTGDHLAFLTDSQSSSLSHFYEPFAVVSVILKTFESCTNLWCLKDFSPYSIPLSALLSPVSFQANLFLLW